MTVTPITVTPVPSRGDVFTGRDVAGRVLRISSHPESDRIVLSVWQGPRCVATVRLAGEDVPDVVAALVRSALPPPPAPAPARTASVSPLRSGMARVRSAVRRWVASARGGIGR